MNDHPALTTGVRHNLLLSPLTDAAVMERETQARFALSSAVLRGEHEPDAWGHAYFAETIDECRLYDLATSQRIFRHPGGLSGVVAEQVSA